MNWPRARAILIISFLALDLFLGYVLLDSQREFSELTASEVQQAIETAAEYGILVSSQMPRRVMAVPFLVVRPQEADAQMLAERLLGPEQVHTVQSSKELSVWANDEGQVTILSTGVVIYNRAKIEPRTQSTPLDLRAARAALEKFLSERGMFPGDARFDFAEEMSPGVFFLRYYQEYQGYPVFGGYITATVDERGVENMRKIWFSPVGLGEQRRLLMTAPDALVTAAPEIANQLGRTVTLESVKFGYLSEALDARQWDVLPVWRFGFSDFMFVYVDGYSGEVLKIDTTKR